MQAVAIHVLSEFEPVLDASDQWQAQLVSWAVQVRRYLNQHTYVFNIMGWQGHVAVAWLHHLAILSRIIRLSGLRGDALADAVQWVANTLMGAIYLEVGSRKFGSRVDLLDVDQLPDQDAEEIAGIMKYLSAKSSAQAFDDNIREVILRVEAKAAEPGNSTSNNTQK